MSKRPTPAAVARVRAALPLSALPTRPTDPITACNVCGLPSEKLELYRECNEYDLPERFGDGGDPHTPAQGDGGARIFLGADHPECQKALKKHPRLYIGATGDPGTFPGLCGPCELRDGAKCTSPKTKANGGSGLLVHLSRGLPPGVIICPPPRIVHRAVTCEHRVIA